MLKSLLFVLLVLSSAARLSRPTPRVEAESLTTYFDRMFDEYVDRSPLLSQAWDKRLR